jgi:hypothetical protein
MDHHRLPGYSLAQTKITNIVSRRVWSPKARRTCVEKIAAVLNAEFGIDPAQLPADTENVALGLRERGIVFQDSVFSEGEVTAIREHFVQRKPHQDKPDRYYHPLRDIIEAPGLLEAALSEQALAPLAQYFGTMPFLTGLRTWWMDHDGFDDADLIPHRDQCDILFAKLFIYLTDVSADDAPHIFFAGSHNYNYVKSKLVAAGVAKDQLQNALRYVFETNFHEIGPDIVKLFEDDCITVTGKAGTTFIADTGALHHGQLPAPGHTRLMFSAIYSMNLDPTNFAATSGSGPLAPGGNPA